MSSLDRFVLVTAFVIMVLGWRLLCWGIKQLSGNHARLLRLMEETRDQANAARLSADRAHAVAEAIEKKLEQRERQRGAYR